MIRYYETMEDIVNESLKDIRDYQVKVIDLNWSKEESEEIANAIIKQLESDKIEVKTMIFQSNDKMYNLRVQLV